MPLPVFKTGEGSGNRLLVGSIPMRSRHSGLWRLLLRRGKQRFLIPLPSPQVRDDQ